VTDMSRDPLPAGRATARYRMEVRLSAGDVGSRVVIRWRRPAEDGDEIADVLGVLAAADAASFTVRKASGELVTIPSDRALAGKTVPAAPPRRQRAGSSAGESPPVSQGEEASSLSEARYYDDAGRFCLSCVMVCRAIGSVTCPCNGV
jgi:hypothetical protein